MKKNSSLLNLLKSYKKILLEILGIFLILIIYQIISFLVNDPLFIPPISKISSSLVELCSLSYTYVAFGKSLARTLIAILLSFIFAFLLGSLAGYFKSLRYLLNPFIGMMKLLPTPFVVFLIFLFFYRDLNFGSIIITFIVVFPILYESFIAGHDNIDESIKLSLRLEGYYKPKCFFKVILVESLPYIALGVTNSLALGVKVSIMSEILIGSSEVEGIGSLIYDFRVNSDYSSMIALIFLVLVIFVLFDLIIKLSKKIIKF